MKLSEFKEIMHLLDDDIEVIIKQPNDKQKKPGLITQNWGNHDGRYNVHCQACGYTSGDIPRNEPAPKYCPQCGK